MQKTRTKLWSVLLAVLLVFTALMPALNAAAASATITVTNEDGAEVTERLTVQEYGHIQLGYTTAGDVPGGAYVTWESNLPLLAGVDDSGRVSGYDYSKAAIIEKWIDENIRSLPLVGNSMADEIERQIQAKCDEMGVDLADLNNDMIVLIVRAVAGDTLADSLEKTLAGMNVKITATLHAADGSVLAADTVEVVVEKSAIADVAPTAVHITNKNAVPTTVAVGTTVQLYGVCTPVRLKQGVKWTMGGTIFDTESGKHANVSSDGLVTFTSAGTVTVRLNPENGLYSAFTDKITFTVVEQSELPVEDFTIAGTTKVDEGATTQLAIDNLTPAGAYTGDLTWTSSDPTVAVVDRNGIVTGLDGGSGLTTYSRTTTVTATVGGVSRSVEVTVSRKLTGSVISGVEIAGDETIPNNTSTTYAANVTPDRLNTSSSVNRIWGVEEPLNNNEIVWASAETPADTSIAAITADGVLTPKQSGIITIHVRAVQGEVVCEASKTVSAGTPITSFALGKGDGFTTNVLTGSRDSFLEEGKSAQINIQNILPENHDPDLLNHVVWTSSDPTVASVDENGRVMGLDCGANSLGTIYDKKTVTITASVGGVSASITFDVRGASVNHLVSAAIIGSDYVIRDFPRSYTASFSPSRIEAKNVHWGVPAAEGERPWADSWNSTSGNTENSFASVDGSGTVTGLSAGSTTLWLFGRTGATSWGTGSSYVEATKEIEVVELEPESITLTAPTRTNYVEGETELDLTGMKLVLNYSREAVSQYYDTTDWEDKDFSVEVTDYTVTEINQNVLDSEQYILVTVTRAGKDYRGVFPITLESKKVTDISLVNPRYIYLEGETELDLNGLEVTANYSNAASEVVTDYTVDDHAFDPALLDTEQSIPVTYTHAGFSATAAFPVIVYGIPVVSVDTGDYAGGWTPNDVTFTLSATHPMDGLTYYYRTAENTEWTALAGNTLTVSENSQDTYFFKAVNSADVESAETVGYTVLRDDITPSFALAPSVTALTNQSFRVAVENLTVGSSGVQSVTLNGTDIMADYASFTVDENGTYTVVVTANNGLYSEKTVTVDYIDKIAPVVAAVDLQQKNSGGFARLLNGMTFGKFFKEQIELTIQASDEGVAGLDRIEYRFYNADTNTYSEWKTYDAGNKPVQNPNFKGYAQTRAVDRAANVSAVLTSEGYVVDNAAPTDVQASASYNGADYDSSTWVAGDVDITLESTAYSGIYAYYYRVDGGEWQQLSGNTVTATEEGSHLYEFKAESNTTLESAVTPLTVQIDRQKPVIRLTFDGTFGRWTADGARFNFTTEEESLSGITYYYNDGTGWYDFDGSELVLNYNTNTSYSFKAVNGAGTESTASDSYHVMIDITQPDVTLTPTVTGRTEEPYAVNFETVVGESGLASVTVDGRDITGQTSFIVSENGNYLVTVTGNNGKVKTVILTVENFQDNSETPILQVSVSGAVGVRTDKPIVFTLTTPNYLSGITYYYSTGDGWVQLSGDTLTIDAETKATYTFKAVNAAGKESYVSPAYAVWFEKIEMQQILPKEDGTTLLIVDRSQTTTYLIGLNAENTSVADLKAQLQNEGMQIVVLRGDTVLGDLDRVGTGCVVQCVSEKDPSVIYESVTVILYGDVNGDGLIDDADYELMQSAALMDAALIAEGAYTIAADVNGDGAVDCFDAAMLDLQISGTVPLDQTKQYYK